MRWAWIRRKKRCLSLSSRGLHQVTECHTQSLWFLTFPCRLDSMKSQKLQNLLTEKENIAHFDLIRRFTTLLSISKIELDDFLLFLLAISEWTVLYIHMCSVNGSIYSTQLKRWNVLSNLLLQARAPRFFPHGKFPTTHAAHASPENCTICTNNHSACRKYSHLVRCRWSVRSFSFPRIIFRSSSVAKVVVAAEVYCEEGRR